MKKFKHLALLLLAAITVFGCSNDYDDSGIKKDISDLQSRVEKLEKWCDTANGQITSLQGLVTALQGNDYVMGVTPVMEGTTEVGYTISFAQSSPITIMHGKNGTNGKDGVTPIIGVKKHTDNLYYWTIQIGSAAATWIKDADGNMIPTTGKDGAAGQKPIVGIAKDGDRYYWQVDGKWLEDADGNKVPATGDNGDSFFKSVTPDTAKGTVVIKLSNDTEFTLPMLSTTISFDAYTALQIATAGTETAVTVILSETLKKADFAAIKADITNMAGTNTAITRATTEKWTIDLKAPTFKQDGTLDIQPEVKVTVPVTATAGETALLEVTVVDTKGNKSTSTRVLFYDNTVAVTGVTLDNTTLTVNVGKTGTTIATVAPANASNQNVAWSTSDATIATLANGVVTGVKAGTATITATTEDGSFTATCAVTVTAAPPITWATGNLVANADGSGCEVGATADGSLYFQFGSLIGWSTTGDPTIAVKPANYTGSTSWSSSWEGDSTTENATAGTGDPCKYYLKGTWRLPTLAEYEALFKDCINSFTGPWTWNKDSKSAIHENGLTFPALGSRHSSTGKVDSFGFGFYWSSTGYIGQAYSLSFLSSGLFGTGFGSRGSGHSVRCVQD